MSRFILRTGTAALLLPLAACVNMSGLGGDSKYACAAPEGVACDSVSGTYANAVHNNLPSQRRAQANAPAPSSGTQANAPAPARQAPTAAAPASASPSATPAPQALRSQARYLRLWIKPWEDIDGDLFDQAHVYVQVDHGRWQIDHVRQQIRERYAPLRPPVSSSTPTGQSDGGVDPNAADAAPTTDPIRQQPVTDPRRLFPSLATPPSGPGARPQ